MNALKDPSSFGPPPKHRDAYGEQVATASIPTPSTSTAPRAAHPSTVPQESTLVPSRPSVSHPGPAVPPRAGTVGTTSAARREESASPEVPAGPFRADTTGLSTNNLPPPPAHRDRRAVDSTSPPARSGAAPSTRNPRPPVAVARSMQLPPVPTRSSVTQSQTRTPPPTKPKPSLPPRSSVAGGLQHDPDVVETPPPPYSERPNPVTNASPAVSELQQRFARIRARENESEGHGGGQATQTSSSGAQEALTPPPIPTATKPI